MTKAMGLIVANPEVYGSGVPSSLQELVENEKKEGLPIS